MIVKICGECGGRKLVPFKNETLSTGAVEVTGLAGYKCADCGETYLDRTSQARYAAALDTEVMTERRADRAMLLRVRKKLKLTQQQAAELTGGGHNAFSRYERGEVYPMPAVINLFKLLDKHPGLLKDVRS